MAQENAQRSSGPHNPDMPQPLPLASRIGHNPLVQPLAQQHRLRWHVGTVALAVAASSGLACAIGAGLGLFLGDLVLCALLAPYAAALWDDPRHGLIASACVIHGIAATWLVAAWVDQGITVREWLGAYAMLLSFGLAMATLVSALRRAGIHAASSAGLAVLMAILWLTVPVWLFPHLQSPGLLPWMQRLISIHPVFAINSEIKLTIWSEMPIAYTLTNLNQDVPYSLPASPLAAVLAHGAIALAICLIWIKEDRRNAR